MRRALSLFIIAFLSISQGCVSSRSNLTSINSSRADTPSMSLLIEEGLNSGWKHHTSHDGSLIAVYNGKDIVIKSISTGKTIKRLDKTDASSFTFAPAANFFYVKDNGKIHVWNIHEDWKHSSFKIPKELIHDFYVSPSGQKIFVKSWNKHATAYIYSRDGKKLSSFPFLYKKDTLTERVVFSGENELLTTYKYRLLRVKFGPNRHSIRIVYNGNSKARFKDFNKQFYNNGEVKGISRNGKYFATGYIDPHKNVHMKGATTTIKIRRCRDAKVVRRFTVNKNYDERPSQNSAISISNNGRYIAASVNGIPTIFHNKTAKKFKDYSGGDVEFIEGLSLALVIPDKGTAVPSILYDIDNEFVVTEFSPGQRHVKKLVFNDKTSDLFMDGYRVNLSTGAYIPYPYKDGQIIVNSLGENLSVTTRGEIYKLNNSSFGLVI